MSISKIQSKFIHSPDQLDLWKKILSLRNTIPYQLASNVGIITWNNQKYSILEESLKDHDLSFQVYGKDVLIWNNFLKFDYILKNDFSRFEYLIGLDSHDVIVHQNLENIVELFQEFDCDLLFNSEIKFYPDLNLSYFQEMKEFQNQVKKTDFCFLNSGCWMGKREFCLEFFEYCSKIKLWEQMDTTDFTKIYNCDQSIVHGGFKKFFPRVQLDYFNKIFLNIAHLTHLRI